MKRRWFWLVALAPLVAGWGGALSLGPYPWQAWMSVSLIAAYLAFFPVAVGMLRGLESPGSAGVELMRSYAAGELTIFRRVRFPNALPYIFTALKVASVLAMIGAIVGEYFGGSIEALGVQIKNSASLFQFDVAWAAIVVACILGIAFYLAVAILERLVTRWQPSVGARAE